MELITGFGLLCIFAEMVSRGGGDAPSVIKLDTVKRIAEQVNLIINLYSLSFSSLYSLYIK